MAKCPEGGACLLNCRTSLELMGLELLLKSKELDVKVSAKPAPISLLLYTVDVGLCIDLKCHEIMV